MWGGARQKGIAGAVLAAALAWTAPAPAAELVDLLLVLAVDNSRSIDDSKFQQLRAGHTAALKDRDVLRAIGTGPYRRVAISLIDWSGYYEQKIVVDWTLVHDEASARAFSERVAAAPRSFNRTTAIGAAINFAAAHFEVAPFTAARRVLDISGDGTENVGEGEAPQARDKAVARGIVINATAIVTVPRPGGWNPGHIDPAGGLKTYWEANVAGGAGSFVMAAAGFPAFKATATEKLVAEIAGRNRP
jgi:hypothetical protein